jgi:prepilin-type N-terminal cleavage/methylation domain-containing protein
MKRLSSKARVEAFTLIELLVVIAIIAILAAMVLPTLSGGGRSLRVRCINNLRQVALGFQIWASDHEGKFPAQMPIAKNGSMEFVPTGIACLQFRAITEQVHNSQSFVCPYDKTRRPADNYKEVRDENISYFANQDVATNKLTQLILAGDRNLQADGQPVSSGLFLLTTNKDMSWTSELHRLGGCLAFYDGHVEWSRSNNFNKVIQNQPLTTNRLAVP